MSFNIKSATVLPLPPVLKLQFKRLITDKNEEKKKNLAKLKINYLKKETEPNYHNKIKSSLVTSYCETKTRANSLKKFTDLVKVTNQIYPNLKKQDPISWSTYLGFI